MNKNPPANPIFLRNDTSCDWSEKSKWKRKAVVKQKIARIPAANLAWYPTITRTGKIISIAMAGKIRKPGTPKPSIQPTEASKLKILLKAETRNRADIKILPKKSKIFITLKN